MNTKHYILLMATALMMVGCAFDDPMEKQKPWVENDSELPKPVDFSVSTANSVEFTRAAESIVTFNKDEKIRVLVKPDGSEAYTPYDYTAAETGQNVALTAPDPQPYFPAGVHTTVDAYAFYPATANTSSSVAFTVADYQRDAADYKASDLMMADNRTITKDMDDGKNSLTMKHLMAQLRVKAVPDSASDLKITKILVEAKRSLFFTPEGETITTTSGEMGTITVLNELDLADCKGGEGYILFPPQAIKDVTIKVVTGKGRARDIASFNFAANGSFAAGASYGVDITVTPEQLGFTTAIANWNGMGSVIIAPTGDFVIDPIDAQPWNNGTPITPTIKVKKGGKLLTEGTHYKLEYLNNKDVGTAYVVVTGLKSNLDPEDENYFDYTNSCGVAPFKITAAIATISFGDITEVKVTYGAEPFITPLFNGGDGDVTYTSDDPSIATVDASTGKVTILKTGTTIIRATVEDGANFIYDDDAREISYKLIVTNAAGSIKFDEKTPSQEWKADGNKNYFTQTVTHVGTGTVTYTVPETTSPDNTCGATIDGSTVHFTQAGQVVVTATVEDNNLYTYDAEHRTATYTLTVTKAKGFVNLSSYSGNLPYMQEVKMFSIGETHGGAITVASNDTTIAKVTESGGNVHVRGVKAGSTKIVVTCATTTQYLEAKAEYTVDVKPINITGVIVPAANDLTYTGSAQALVAAGSADYGQVQYSLGNNQNWSNTVPTATNAGTYKVYWQVKGDANHSTYTPEEPIEVTIAKAAPTYTAPAAKTLTYTGSAQALVTAGSTEHGSIQFSRNGTSGWTTTVPTETDAGTYTVYWKLVGDDNHNSKNAASISVTIKVKTQSSPTITLSPTSCTYNGAAQKPSVTVKDGSVTIPASEYTVAYSNNTNAGTATVTITDKTGGNYTVSGTKTFTISPKTVSSPTITLATTSYTYDGSAKKPTVSSVKDGSTTIPASEYTVGYSNNTNAGTATVTITDKSGGNYTVSGKTTFTIKAKALTSTEFKYATTTIDKDYVWQLKGYKNTLTMPSGCTVTYTSSNTGVATVSSSGALTPAGTVGTYTTITAKATGNYSGSATYKIKAASKVLTYAYTGKAQTAKVGAGKYTIECWGAQGGAGVNDGGAGTGGAGGKGGYAKGTITLTATTTFYVYVGGKGTDGANKKDVNGGWNGGAKGIWDQNDDDSGGGGGGATDIRITYGDWNNFTSLASRIMVAGGGGGGARQFAGGGGGGTSGSTGAGTADNKTTPGTQTSGYKFGWGQDGSHFASNICMGGGGGGYYGAKARTSGTVTTGHIGGSGGSGFVSGMSGCNAITSGSTASSIKASGSANHSSGYVFTSASMSNGVQAGNGKATITWVGN